MFVCLCTGVTSEVIEDLVANGAVSTNEIAQACGAGMECGRCRRTVRGIIAGNNVPVVQCPTVHRVVMPGCRGGRTQLLDHVSSVDSNSARAIRTMRALRSNNE